MEYRTEEGVPLLRRPYIIATVNTEIYNDATISSITQMGW